MKTIYILNPAAGQGEALKYVCENSYITKAKGDAAEFVKTTIEAETDNLHFVVCGGDGTVNEVVNGIVSANGTASFSIIPVGTGNDLLRTMQTQNEGVMTDVLTVNGRCAMNAVNTGFDLDVVLKAAQYKKLPLVSGSLAYVLGVFSVLFKKFGRHIDVTYTDQNDIEHKFSGDSLLAVAANGIYYGGGFKCAPVSDITDGLIDLLIVKKVSRLKFLSLVLKYKKGLHIDPKTHQPIPSFKKYVVFAKCKRVVIDGISKICADGEVWDTTTADINIIPNAVKITMEN